MGAVLSMEGLGEENLCGQKSRAETGIFWSYTLVWQLQRCCAVGMNYVHKEAESTILIYLITYGLPGRISYRAKGIWQVRKHILFIF